MLTPKKVTIIGAGVVGTALGYLLKKKGYRIVGIGSRTVRSARNARKVIGEGRASADLAGIAKIADIVFLTTSDRAIGKTCSRIASEGGFHQGSIVFHTCGAFSSGILSPAKKRGAAVASLHPLQSLANFREAIKNIPGSFFSLEGDAAAVAAGRKIVEALRGKEIPLDSAKKSLYHAGAVAASNFLVATIGFSLELFEAAGIGREESLHALEPLIQGTIKNIQALGIPQALTGPIARGDAGVVRDHLKALLKEKPELLRLYAEIGKYTVKLGVEKGTLKDSAAKKIVSLLDREYI